MRTIDLLNLENNMEEIMGNIESNKMGHMDNNMEENMEKISKLIKNTKENLPKCDDVYQCTQEDKDNVHVEKTYINKHNTRCFYSNNGSNKGWPPMVIQLPNIE